MVTRNVVVVAAHPVPDSYGAAIRDAVVGALDHASNELSVIDLYAEAFDPRRSWVLSADGAAAVARHRAALDDADALVFVHPTWWGGQPAIVKGWLDAVWDDDERRTGIEALAVVCTHGSTRARNAVQGVPGRRTVFRALRMRCARRCRTTWVSIYSMDRIGEKERVAFLARVKKVFATW